MRIALILPVATFLLALPAPLPAGIYNTAEPTEDQLDPEYVVRFHRHLLILRSFAMDKVPFDNPQRRRYVLQDLLAAKADVSRLPVEQQVNLSAVLIRRNKPDAALRILMPLAAERRHPSSVADLLVQANLATAYFLAGHESRGVDHLDALLQNWPKDWHHWKDTPLVAEWIGYGWSEAEFYRYREAEMYLLKLFRGRAREPKDKRMNPQQLDPLFDVRFLGDGGEFQPGGIAAAERAKLPKNAVDIVEQLVNWLPFDDRLYWLLGEVVNAAGESSLPRPTAKQLEAARVKAARMIFKELVENRNFRATAVLAHRHKLMEYVDPPTELPSVDDDDPSREGKKPDDEAAPTDWRSLGIAFGAGVLVTIFGILQIREIQRRRRKS